MKRICIGLFRDCRTRAGSAWQAPRRQVSDARLISSTIRVAAYSAIDLRLFRQQNFPLPYALLFLPTHQGGPIRLRVWPDAYELRLRLRLRLRLYDMAPRYV
jgi:hypothetical protein